MKKNELARVLGVCLTTLLFASAAHAEQPDPNRMLVKFKSGAKLKESKARLAADGQVHRAFDNLRTVSVSLPPGLVKKLRNDPDIERIEPDLVRYPMAQSVPYGVDKVQARQVWDANLDGVIDTGAATGAGIKVCVIDSGINSSHEDFSGVTLTGYSTGWDKDECGHGSHVAGTIAAANNTKGVVGVSPGKVSLQIVKVFGRDNYDSCAWTYSSTLIDAANRCAAAGSKIISMSLGGYGSTATEREAFQTHANNGIISIAAAGNEGSDPDLAGQKSYPASYDSVISVAAVDESDVKADFSQYNNAVDVAAPGVGVLSAGVLNNDPLTVGTSTFVQNPVGGAKLTTASAGWVNGGLCTKSATSWRGKIVLCKRGTTTFYEKVSMAKSGRAVGVVIYNNVAEPLYADFGDGLLVSIPAVGINKADGEKIIADLAGKTVTIDSIASTSNTGYVKMDGTSMATPHVSGVAALVWSSKPTATSAEVRDALLVTARDIDAEGYDNNTGWGMVQAADAVTELNRTDVEE